MAELPFLAGEHGRGPFLVILFFLAAGIITVSGIWEGTLPRSEEAVFAETSREVLVTGDCLIMHFDGEPVYDTPPLAACITAVFLKIFGNRVFAARLPFVIFALCALYAVYLVGGVTAGGEPYSGAWITQARAVGLASAIILGASTAFGRYAPHIITEVPLAFFVTLALLGWFYLPAGKWGLLLWGLGIAGGALSAGSGAFLVIPGSLLALVTDRKRRALWRNPPFILVTLAALLLGGSWLLWTAQRAPGGVRESVLMAHMTGFAFPRQGVIKGILRAVKELWLRNLPWSIPATAAVIRILFIRKRGRRGDGLSAADNTLLAFAAILFLGIVLSGPAGPVAFVPLLPLCALLGAREIARWTAYQEEAGDRSRDPECSAFKLWSFNQTMTAIFCLVMLLLAATPLGLHDRSYDPIEDIAKTAGKNTEDGTRLGNFRQDYRTQAARLLFYGSRSLEPAVTNPVDVTEQFESDPDKIFLATASDMNLLKLAQDFNLRLVVLYRAGDLVLFGLHESERETLAQ